MIRTRANLDGATTGLHGLCFRSRKPVADETDQHLDGEPLRQQQIIGEAVTRTGEQLKRPPLLRIELGPTAEMHVRDQDAETVLAALRMTSRTTPGFDSMGT